VALARIAVDGDDGPAALPEIAATLWSLGVPLSSVSTYPAEQERLRVVVRVERAIPLASRVEVLREGELETVHASDGGRVGIEFARTLRT